MQNIREAMDDLKLSEDIRNAIRPFSVFGFDMHHAGMPSSKYGAILGIPCNFNNTTQQLRANLHIKEEEIDWTRKDAQNLLNASMLSTNAQKFAIAREILLIQAEEPYSNSLRLALITAVFWTLYNTMSRRFKLRERSVTIRRIFCSVFVLLGAILWIGIKDHQSYHLDGQVDKALCGLGIEYIRGGQEFYKKILDRNKAIRSLLGKDGEKTYTVYGNEQTSLRLPHMPLSQRRQYCDTYLLNSNNQKLK